MKQGGKAFLPASFNTFSHHCGIVAEYPLWWVQKSQILYENISKHWYRRNQMTYSNGMLLSSMKAHKIDIFWYSTERMEAFSNSYSVQKKNTNEFWKLLTKIPFQTLPHLHDSFSTFLGMNQYYITIFTSPFLNININYTVNLPHNIEHSSGTFNISDMKEEK